jgi:transcriptional regulator with PAS, ATPase and Fis domain
MVKDKTFRDDLFYRINVVRISIPPLRERKDDIPLLIEHFLNHFNKIHAKEIENVSDKALTALMQHNYPGNIRELENAMEHAFVLCSGNKIQLNHLPPQIAAHAKFHNDNNSAETLAEKEKAAIIETLKDNNYNRLVTAHKLGIHKSTLFRKIKKYGISIPRSSS